MNVPRDHSWGVPPGLVERLGKGPAWLSANGQGHTGQRKAFAMPMPVVLLRAPRVLSQPSPSHPSHHLRMQIHEGLPRSLKRGRLTNSSGGRNLPCGLLKRVCTRPTAGKGMLQQMAIIPTFPCQLPTSEIAKAIPMGSAYREMPFTPSRLSS